MPWHAGEGWSARWKGRRPPLSTCHAPLPMHGQGLFQLVILHLALPFCILLCVFQISLSLDQLVLPTSHFGLAVQGFSRSFNCPSPSPASQICPCSLQIALLHHYPGPGFCFYIRQRRPWHKILKLCYPSSLGQGHPISPHQLRNSTCLVHGESLMCFNSSTERGVTQVHIAARAQAHLSVPSSCLSHDSEDQTI